jgi:hypothetical protein
MEVEVMKRLILVATAIFILIAMIIVGQSCITKYTEAESEKAAHNFVQNSSTYTFDGMSETLELVNTRGLEDASSWEFTYRFESRHAGYGNREGQMLAQVITPHEAMITVENGEVKSAVMDEKWDMINQKVISES